jgi:hypothetical protein
VRHRFHALCPYFAMFPEIFVRKHLVWSKRGDLVLDPFSGRGTTMFESLLNDRRAIACDTNPVAVCVSRAKSAAPTMEETLDRVLELQHAPADNWMERDIDNEFFRLCFHPDTLKQIQHLRKNLRWQIDRVDCFIAAIALGCLHGESHRSQRYFSNRMPRTISTKPEYSVRWWKMQGCLPPARNVYDILRREIEYRFGTPPPQNQGIVLQGDARNAGHMFREYLRDVSLVITSPPYLDTTNVVEDQWLRVWFLGGEAYPVRDRGKDDRYWSASNYWAFLQEAWSGIAGLLKSNAHLIIRMGGSKLTFDETSSGLKQTLSFGLGRPMTVVEEKVSSISGGQLRSFHPNAVGTKVEFDFHFALT